MELSLFVLTLSSPMYLFLNHFQLFTISVYGRLHVMYVWILYELCHVCDLY